jgi:enamine deaminase RidA (YjgF/YER057c/UK114 family)
MNPGSGLIARRERNTGRGLTSARRWTGVAILCLTPAAFSMAQERPPTSLHAIDADPKTGSAAAVIVGPAALGHTGQIFPLDDEGKVVSVGSTGGQIERVFSNLERVMASVDARRDDIVKLNVYAAEVVTADAVRKALAEKFPGKSKPAVCYVVGKLERSGARVALDAVFACDADNQNAVRRINANAGWGIPSAGGALAILPPGPRVYISGQAEESKEMADATRRTLESLKKTLVFLGLTLDDVVQVKSFLGPIEKVAEAEREIVKFFGGKNPPALAFVEWSSSLPIEIEVVARGGNASTRTAESIEFLTPPGMSASPVYCRVARVNAPETIYISGLFGKSRDSGASETEEIFDSLGAILRKTGSDFRHLAKATYYVSTNEASAKLNEIRPKFYDPMRPPAASKAMVAGAGLEGRTITLDLIAVRGPR